jgi:hypothetical protein
MALDANRRPSCGLGVLKNIFHAASILRLVASCLSCSSHDPATWQSVSVSRFLPPQWITNTEASFRPELRWLIVRPLAPYRCFEAGDIDAPAVVSEAASGADIDAAFVEDSDGQIAKHDLALCGRSHCCPPKSKQRPYAARRV